MNGNLSYGELAYLFSHCMGKVESVAVSPHEHVFSLTPTGKVFTLTASKFPFVRSFDMEVEFPVLKPKRKKIRLVKKFARRYGVRFLRDDARIRIDMAVTTL